MRLPFRRICPLIAMLMAGVSVHAQINTDRMMTVGRSALYYEDYVLSIQYFNQVINAKPFLHEPYFFRGVAKLSLEDFAGAENDCSRAISINPYVVDCYQVRGLSRVYQGKYDQAIEDYRTALRWDPENRSMRHNMILCYMRKNSTDEAMAAIDTLLQIAPKYTPAMSMRSHLLLEQQDTLGAMAVLDTALGIDRHDASLFRDRGILKAVMKQYDQAEEDLNMALRYEPSEASFYIDRALIKFYRNNLRGAMADYDIAIEIEPSNILGHYNRGILRSQIGDDNRAIEDFDVVIDGEPDNMMAVFNRGMLRDKTGDLTGAIQDYSTVLSEYPHFIYGYQLRSEARYKLGDRKGGEQDELIVMRDRTSRFNGGQDKDAEEDDSDGDNYRKTRKESDRNVWNYRKIVVAENEGEQFTSEYRGRVQNRNVDVRLLPSFQFTWFADRISEVDREVRFSAEVEGLNAIGKFQSRLLVSNQETALTESQIRTLFDDVTAQTTLISEDPDNPYNYFARAVDFFLLQDFDNAESDFTQAIVTGPGLWAAYFGRAIVRQRTSEMNMAERASEQRGVFVENGDNSANVYYQMVVNDLVKACDLEPDFAYAYYNKANVEASAGDYRNAVADYTTAIALNDHLAEAYYNRGLSLVFLDRIEEGMADLAKAGELGIYSAYNVMKRFSQTGE